MRIAILALDGSLLSAVAGLSDLFWITNQALRSPPVGLDRAQRSTPDLCFETLIVSVDGQPLRDPQGRQIPIDGALPDPETCDAVLVTGIGLGPDGLPPSNDSRQRAAAWVAQCHRANVWIGAACAGTFVLGEAGLLDKRRCTTTWWLHHAFQHRFPKAQLVWGAAMEEQDRIVTTGGPLSWVDLGLLIIRRLAGPTVAKLAADIAVADSQSLPQLVYAPRGFVNMANPLLLQAEQIIRHAQPDLTTEQLAQALQLSERTLHRRLKSLVNESPKTFITRVRIETACMLLEVPDASIKKVANQCGYHDDTTFRRAFSQLIGMPPADYRRWVQMRQQGRSSPSALSAVPCSSFTPN